MKKIFVLTVSVLVLIGCRNQNQRFNMDVAVDVSVQTVTPGPIKDIVAATGDVIPAQKVVLNNEMTGAYFLQKNPVSGKFYKMGDAVKAGTVLIRLEDKAYRNTTNIEGERLNMETARQEYEKLQALYEKGGATQRELVNAEMNLVTAEKNYENAQINLDKMSIEAPFDGVITSLPYYSQGVRVDQGQEMVEIMDFDDLILEITLPSSAFGKVEPGQKTLVTNYASSEDPVTGEVGQLSPVLNVESRSFKGRIHIDNSEKKLRPGMFVNADIIVEQKDSVLTVPPEVVFSQMGGKFVYVVQEETARKRIVQTGLEGKERVEIIEGLTPEEMVVVKGFETLRDGSKIKVTGQVN